MIVADALRPRIATQRAVKSLARRDFFGKRACDGLNERA